MDKAVTLFRISSIDLLLMHVDKLFTLSSNKSIVKFSCAYFDGRCGLCSLDRSTPSHTTLTGGILKFGCLWLPSESGSAGVDLHPITGLDPFLEARQGVRRALYSDIFKLLFDALRMLRARLLSMGAVPVWVSARSLPDTPVLPLLNTQISFSRALFCRQSSHL